MKMKKILMATLAILTIGAGALGIVACEKKTVVQEHVHNWVEDTDKSSAPECNKEGITVWKNCDCGEPKESIPLQQLGHDFQMEIKMEPKKDANGNDVKDANGNVVEEEVEYAICTRCEMTSTRGLQYTLSEYEDYYTVTSFNAPTGVSISEIIIPSQWKGLPVKNIGANAFAGKFVEPPKDYTGRIFVNVSKVQIAYGVESVGASAFSGCTSLREVDFQNVKTIDTIPFNDINEYLEKIGDGAFENCTNLTEVKLPNAVKKIGGWVFRGCSAMTSANLGGVTKIEHQLFYNCKNLQSVTMSNDVTAIESWAFGKCGQLANITLPEKLTKIDDGAFYTCGNLQEIVIPDSVTEIGEDAFYQCTKLQTVTFGSKSKVATIGDKAFYACKSLKKISIPNSVTTLGNLVFYGCDNLTSADIGSKVKAIGDSAFAYCPCLMSVNIGAAVESIGTEAFYKCISLMSIEIPNKVKTIGKSAFAYCTELRSVFFANPNAWNADLWPLSKEDLSDPEKAAENLGINYYDYIWAVNSEINNENNSVDLQYELAQDEQSYIVTGIGDCTDKEIVIPYSYQGLPVTAIGKEAFYYCHDLTSVEMTSSITSIGERAFAWCIQLQEVKFAKNVTPNLKQIGAEAFSNCHELASITLPGAIVPEDKTQAPYGGLQSIGEKAFEYCNSLTTVVVPDSVVSIGMAAFEGCDKLTNLTIPFVGATKNGTENTHFGYIFNAEYYYENGECVPASLKSVTIKGGSIAENAFYYCYGVTTVNISDGITTISDKAFIYCEGLEVVTIGKDVTSIGANAFKGCKNLKSVTFATKKGWKAGSDSLKEEDLKDVAKAATYLTTTYCDKAWKLTK